MQAGDIVTISGRDGRWALLDLMPTYPGNRWRCRLEESDGEPNPIEIDADEAAMTLLLRPTFAEGDIFKHFGQDVTVVSDQGESVLCLGPDKRVPLEFMPSGGEVSVKIPVNVSAISKGALVAENLNRLIEEQSSP